MSIIHRTLYATFYRYDKVLFVALQALKSLSSPVYHIALRELCGNFHYLISQYLYLHGHVFGRASDVCLYIQPKGIL